MKIIDNYYELPVSLSLGFAAPLCYLMGSHARESHTQNLVLAAQHVQGCGSSFVLALVATLCLKNARQVEEYGWMTGWSVLLKVWMAFTLVNFFDWIPQIV